MRHCQLCRRQHTIHIDFNLEEGMQKLQLITNNLFEWFKTNHIKANADKCHLLVTRDTDVTAKIGEFDVKKSREEKLLGIKIDIKLSKIMFLRFAKRQAKSSMHSKES